MNTFGWNYIYFIIQGAGWTLAISLVAFIGGAVAGGAVALARVSRHAAWRRLAGVYIQIVQGTPLLIVMFLVYFGLSFIGLNSLPAMIAAGVAMTIYSAAFLGEIWQGCIQAVPKTQWEASECLGLDRTQQLLKVVLPQALRIATPPTVGFMVQIVKNTSLASVIGIVELSQAGKLVNNATFQPFLVFGVVAIIYFILCYPLSVLSKGLERRLNVARR